MPLAVVTGASGFIGRHLVGRLAADGLDVCGVDRRPPPRGAPGSAVVADLAEHDPAVDAILRRADVAYHLAGCPGVRGDGPGVADRRWRDNVVAAEHVLDIVAERVPVVVTSSSSVYGGATHTPDGLRPCRESDRLRPRGGYARSKVVLERRCADRVARGGLVAVARPFTVAGEHQRPDMAIARWLAAARTGGPLAVFGSLHRVRDVTDVGHVVDGLVRLAALRRPATVNLGTGVGHALAGLVAAVTAVAGRAPVEILPAHLDEVSATLADTERCQRLLGFRPMTDLADLVARQWAAAQVRAPDLVEAP
ncbi:MAG: NAD(P)-dependent oxidoreductase [Actinobacteria bacterium]|nr:NAD(P)-dependent oxidoreductase [Actinomycetota bacterium]